MPKTKRWSDFGIASMLYSIVQQSYTSMNLMFCLKFGKKLSTAYAAIATFTSMIQSYPDLELMSQNQYTEFLDTSELLSWQKDELRTTEDRNARYQDVIFWHRLDKVRNLHSDFHNYFISKGIFIQPELKEKIRSLSNMMYDAFKERQDDKQYPVIGEGRFAKGDMLWREGPAQLQAIEKEVQARLWEANKID